MKDEEIKKLAREFLDHIAVEGVERQEQLLIQFGREVAHQTTLWAHKISMSAVSEISSRKYAG